MQGKGGGEGGKGREGKARESYRIPPIGRILVGGITWWMNSCGGTRKRGEGGKGNRMST